jgi:hypothetical protein
MYGVPNIGRTTTDANIKRFSSTPSSKGDRLWSVKLIPTEDITFTTEAEKQQAELIVDRGVPISPRMESEKQVLDSYGTVDLLYEELIRYRDRPYFKVKVELKRPPTTGESNSVAIVLLPVGEGITREVVRTAFQKSIRTKKKAVIV